MHKSWRHPEISGRPTSNLQAGNLIKELFMGLRLQMDEDVRASTRSRRPHWSYSTSLRFTDHCTGITRGRSVDGQGSARNYMVSATSTGVVSSSILSRPGQIGMGRKMWDAC